MSLVGIILAGGASSRMGTPKALLDFGGETFLDRLIRVLGSGCAPVIVVLGHEAEGIRAGIRRAGAATFVLNTDYRDGQLSSLQCALRAVPADADGFLFTPVDYPAIHPDTIVRLAERAAVLPDPWLVIPRYRGRRGHPAGCSPDLIPEFLALPRDSQARTVIHRHIGDTCYVEVEDPGILEDVDDPDAYQKLVRAAQRP